MGRVAAVCISERKGTVKKDIGECLLIKEYGLKNDAHAGSGRQVSLLPAESVDRFRELMKDRADLIVSGVFGENILTYGIDYTLCPVGTRLRAGEALLEITQIGKQCHSDCEIRRIAGDCIMPREGIFARVLEGGMVKSGDEICIVEKRPFSACVLTASDRASVGAYEDRSGPAVEEILLKAGYEVKESVICSDDEEEVYSALVRLTDGVRPDVIFTTGGTGFSLRDRVPEATYRAADRSAPGIAEAIRAYSMNITKKAMLSRAASAIRGRTLIINLPGSPKAVNECMEFVLENIPHGLSLLRGEADA